MSKACLKYRCGEWSLNILGLVKFYSNFTGLAVSFFSCYVRLAVSIFHKAKGLKVLIRFFFFV